MHMKSRARGKGDKYKFRNSASWGTVKGEKSFMQSQTNVTTLGINQLVAHLQNQTEMKKTWSLFHSWCMISCCAWGCFTILCLLSQTFREFISQQALYTTLILILKRMSVILLFVPHLMKVCCRFELLYSRLCVFCHSNYYTQCARLHCLFIALCFYFAFYGHKNHPFHVQLKMRKIITTTKPANRRCSAELHQ